MFNENGIPLTRRMTNGVPANRYPNLTEELKRFRLQQEAQLLERELFPMPVAPVLKVKKDKRLLLL